METIQFASLIGLMCVVVAMVGVLTNQARLERHLQSGWGSALRRGLVCLTEAPATHRLDRTRR